MNQARDAVSSRDSSNRIEARGLLTSALLLRGVSPCHELTTKCVILESRFGAIGSSTSSQHEFPSSQKSFNRVPRQRGNYANPARSFGCDASLLHRIQSERPP